MLCVLNSAQKTLVFDDPLGLLHYHSETTLRAEQLMRFQKPTAILFGLIATLFIAVTTQAQNIPVAGFGTSLKFDGTDDYAQINNYNGPTNDFTIEFWVKPIDLNGGWRGFFGHQPGGANTRAPSMWQNGNQWHCDIYRTDGTRFEVTLSNVFQNPNEWVHLAWVKSGTTMYYYRNGQQISSRSAPAKRL